MGLGGNFFSLEEGPQARDNLGRAIPIANNSSRRIARTIDIRWIAFQHAQTSAGIHHNTRQWLAHLMSDRCCQDSEACNATRMGKFRSCLGERFLSLFPGIDVSQEDVPSQDATFNVTKRESAGMEPSILAIS
ncbi:MAG: hypothetical protein WBE56_22630, partial [Terracidiphilus sp.]